jgi:hypothetical protein
VMPDRLFDLPPLTPGYLSTKPAEKESATVRLTRRNNDLLAHGLHPATGAALLDPEWGYHCGDCAHARHVTNGNRAWWKCELHRLGVSHSAASDIRVGWPACTRLRVD